MAFKMKGYPYPGKSPLKSHVKGHPAPKKEQQGPVAEKNMDLKPSEMEGTWVYKGKDKGEQIADYADRAEFAREDAFNSEGKKKTKHLKAAKDLERESEIIRVQRNKEIDKKQANKKKPPFKKRK